MTVVADKRLDNDRLDAKLSDLSPNKVLRKVRETVTPQPERKGR